ncbi:hypothetical protein [Nonomuraea dietziae]|uniref:hypothetical protein n=1 Tax=Nonomuraea dietziae TaxID=65515 RepID=UPI0034483A34
MRFAIAVLDSVLPEPVDPQVRDRIGAEARGNPLELPRGLSPAELAFGFDGARSASPVSRVEEDYRRQIAALPAATRQLVLAAAVEAVGDGALLLHAPGTARDRAGGGRSGACHQDIQDMKTYAKVNAPVLGLVAPDTRPWFEGTLPHVATDVRGIVTVDKALHWLCEEDPELVSRSLAQFFA